MPASSRGSLGGRVAALACGTALAAASLAAQERFRAGIDVVSMNVTVMESSRYVTDLEATDFEVYEDGVKQDVSFFSKLQQPIALSVLLDTSASMESKLETAQE